MSHFTLTVVFDEVPEDLDDALNTVMEPFDENKEVDPYLDSDGDETTYNPESKWDWWQIGGRWNGYYPGSTFIQSGTEEAGVLLLQVQMNNMLLRSNEADWSTPDKPGRFNGGMKRFLGLDELREEKGQEAGVTWDEYQEVIAGTPEHQSWSHFRDLVDLAESNAALKLGMGWTGLYEKAQVEFNEKYGLVGDALYEEGNKALHEEWSNEVLPALRRTWADELGYTIDDARRHYGEQPRIQTIRKSERFGRWFMDGPEDLIGKYSREGYIEQQRQAAVPTFALLTAKGEWLAPGRMGWFGMSTAEEADRILFHQGFNDYVDNLPDTAFLVVLDLHI